MYKATIGLEIHAELKTKSKMFCGCVNNPDEERPNVNICPVCTALPGALPTLNQEAILKVLKVGVAVSGKLADFSEFDRKNYFYPDIPKGYQISQYKYPFVSGGEINGIKITRIHLEEDTGTSLHDQGDFSLINFNRSGVPLMELVTEPVITSAKEAGDFARELQLILRYLDVSSANMEKGEMRVEANISVALSGNSQKSALGTKVEVKNLNSFKSVERAIEYEIERQKEILESGGDVVQETRGLDEKTGKTFSQRKKEESHDYRYFPEPDLSKLELSKLPWADGEKIKNELPELPAEKRERYKQNFGIKSEDVEVYINDSFLAGFFEKTVEEIQDEQLKILASNYIISDISGLLKEKGIGKILPKHLEEIIRMIKTNELSSRGAKEVIKEIFSTGLGVEETVKKLKIAQISDLEIVRKIAIKVIDTYPVVVSDYKNGKEPALQFLVGQAMREGRGAINPAVVREEILKIIG